MHVLNVHRVFPQFVEAVQGIVVLFGFAKQDIELQISLQPVMRKVAGAGNNVAVVDVQNGLCWREHVHLCVNVLLSINLDLQLAGANPLNEF